MTNTTNAQTCLEQLQSRIREFEKAQKRYQAYGAADTEPDAVFQSLLRRAVSGKPASIPLDGDGWELYTTSMDCSRAAAALSRAAQACVDLIESYPAKNLREIEAYLSKYCWR
jgi:hypothetical protein